jgi:XTP/dITP diphosphohydrolase
VVVASRNRGKVDELRRLFRGLPWRLLDLDLVPGGPEVQWEEDGATYRENAAIKARAVCAATGLPSLADDSGIEVVALDRWPGVHTARWMGEGVTAERLLSALAKRIASLPTNDRAAIFVCALALAVPRANGEPTSLVTEARLEGVLLTKPRGHRGFGYDPIFVPKGETLTMAQMGQARKDEISHRSRAVQKLLARISSPKTADGGWPSLGQHQE